MAATLQTVPIPAGEAWMFNHNRASLKALATELEVEPRVVIAHAIRVGLATLTTDVAGGDDIDDLKTDAETEAAAL